MAAAAERRSARDLLIVGPGVLGSRLGALWLEREAAASPGSMPVVVGQTSTTNNHASLRRLGITPRTTAQAAERRHERFASVAYTAPPSGSEDYAADVRQALQLWDGTGGFVFTSSAGVYADDDGSACDERSPTVPLGASERTDKLLLAEQAVLEAGGCVARLVGLYHRERGAHTFFLRQGQVPRWGGYVVNLIHYEDAASLVAAALAGPGAEGGTAGAPWRGRVFLGCDNSPVTFDDMMAAVAASGELPGSCVFTGAEGPVRGKRMSNNATRAQLGWQPKYPSFAEFFGSGAKDWYYQNQLAPAGAPHS